MIRKLKLYCRAFGFWQTFLKLFRYANEKLHTDQGGIYTPTRKEQKRMVAKKQRVLFFSDRSFSDASARSSAFAKLFNLLGCRVEYYLVDGVVEKTKLPPLSAYSRLKQGQLQSLALKNCVVILDTANEWKQSLSDRAKAEGGVVIDVALSDCIASEKFCTETLNALHRKTKCADRFYENVSVIILNYNNKNVIFRCLDTLLEFNDRFGYEIIVVDNQSTDGSYETIAERYQSVKLYRNTKNGCSSGRNIGLTHATKDYVIFLDSDQWILHENWLDVYLDIFERVDNVGAIGWTGGWFNKKGYSFHTVNNFSYAYMPPMTLCRCDVGYLGTGGMMVEKALLDEIGGFDLNYDPTCYEDTDLSLEIRHRGKELYYCPYLGVGHLPHQTTKSGSDAHEKLIKAKGDYFVTKWKKKNQKLLRYVK